MASPVFQFPAKKIRAQVIAEYIKSCKGAYKGVVCFTCGNSGQELKSAFEGTNTEVIVMNPKEWWPIERIAIEYPGYFDATSGHLPLWLMVRVAEEFRVQLDFMSRKKGSPILTGDARIPTGSGETIFEIAMAVPERVSTVLIALYDYNRGSQYESRAPLNRAVQTFFPIHFYNARKPKE